MPKMIDEISSKMERQDTMNDIEIPGGAESDFKPLEVVNYPFIVFRQIDRVMLDKRTAGGYGGDWRSVLRYRESVQGLYAILLPNRLAFASEAKKREAHKLHRATTHKAGNGLLNPLLQSELRQIKIASDDLLNWLMEFNSDLMVQKKRAMELIG